MIPLIIFIFLLGYVIIALEHVVKIDKAATALTIGGVLWILLTWITHENLYVEGGVLLEHLSGIGALLFFLIGAMTIVEVIDVHDGFSIIIDRIKTRNKRKFLLIVTILTFCMSAVLGNLTAAIVMIMLLRKLIVNRTDRLMFASMVILSANSGGTWSPIGDVTTVMLWVGGHVTSTNLISYIILPALVSIAIPFFIISYMLKGKNLPHGKSEEEFVNPTGEGLKATTISRVTSKKEETFIFVTGICALLAIPVFKSLLGLPPFLSVTLTLGILWVVTELIYAKKLSHEGAKHPISSIISRVDFSIILFFLGILLAVGALEEAGLLKMLATSADEYIGNVYILNVVIGVLSAIVDNVPLVAGAIGMYDIVPLESLATLPNPEYSKYFIQNGVFWSFLTYCAGVGGSLLIIGSAAGVVVMGLEKISFTWYLKKISLVAFLGYLGGALTYILQMYLVNGIL